MVSEGLDGTFARIAADLHNELEKDQIAINLFATDGPLQVLGAVMRRPGADVGVVQADALESLIQGDPRADARRHLRYVAQLYDEVVHVIARERITNLRQLDGLRVDVGKTGSGSELTARLVFDKLGIKANFANNEMKDALDLLRSGEIDAAFILRPTPAKEIQLFAAKGFHLVDVPWEEALGPTYKSVELEAIDYPTIIGDGETVRTLSVGVVLAVYNWRKGSRGLTRLEHFADSLESRIGKLREPGHHFSWSAVDLSAEAPGWERLERRQNLRRPMQPAPDSARSQRESVRREGIE